MVTATLPKRLMRGVEAGRLENVVADLAGVCLPHLGTRLVGGPPPGIALRGGQRTAKRNDCSDRARVQPVEGCWGEPPQLSFSLRSRAAARTRPGSLDSTSRGLRPPRYEFVLFHQVANRALLQSAKTFLVSTTIRCPSGGFSKLQSAPA